MPALVLGRGTPGLGRRLGSHGGLPLQDRRPPAGIAILCYNRPEHLSDG
ncbi:MAG: hypothetical protein ACRDHL_14185 [Candidatus Promineifilaceae bacterium]